MGNLKTTMIKTRSLDALITIYTNIWQKIAKAKKKEKETRKCYKCDKVKHLAKDSKTKQKIKNRSA